MVPKRAEKSADFSAGDFSDWTVLTSSKRFGSRALLSAAGGPEMSQLFAPNFPEWPKNRGPQKVETSRVFGPVLRCKTGVEARFARDWWTRDVRSLGTPGLGSGPSPGDPAQTSNISGVWTSFSTKSWFGSRDSAESRLDGIGPSFGALAASLAPKLGRQRPEMHRLFP